MNLRTHFSLHAYERVVERLTLESSEVADLLDRDLAVKIGEEKGTRRIHRLFYSHEDRQCFIAIQDEKYRTVVTILPVDYYENLAHKIPPSLLAEAEQMISESTKPEPQAETAAPRAKAGTEQQKATVFKIRGMAMNMQRKPRTFNLGSWPIANHDGSPTRLIQDREFTAEILKRANEKKMPDEYLVGFVIRLGNHGEEFWLAVNEDENGLCDLSPKGHADVATA